MQHTETTQRFSKASIASLAFGIISLLFMTILIIDCADWDFFLAPQFGWFKSIQETLDDWNILVCAVPVVSALVSGVICIRHINRSDNLKGKACAVTGIICAVVFVIFVLVMALTFLFTGFR